MALKNDLDAADVGRRLEAWLPSVLGVDRVGVKEVEIPSASGMSSSTVLVETDLGRGFVVRVPPDEGTGLFHTYDIAREAKVMRAVGEHTDAAVPKVLAHETTGSVLGSEFLLLERVHGQVPGDDPPWVTSGWVTDLTPEQRATMYDSAVRAIASIQQVDPLAVGLADLAYDDFDGRNVEKQLGYWRHFYEWSAAGRSVANIERALEILTDTRPADDEPLVVCWGDSRFGNLMFGPDQQVTGIFDWEMAELGRPEVDFGFFLFTDRMYSDGMGLPRLEGFPPRDAVISRFEELTGRPVRDLQWFEGYASLRGAILTMRVGYKMIDVGLVPEDHPMPHNNPASQALAQILDLPAPEGALGWLEGRS